MNRRDGTLRIAALSIATILSVDLVPATRWAGAAVQTGNSQTVEQLMQGSDCASCHAVDRAVVGPAYVEIAKKYAGQSEVATTLARRIREGGSGRWGNTVMPAHSDLTDAQLRDIVQWILSLKDTSTARAERAPVKSYSYTLQDGKTVSLDFPLLVEGSKDKVTKDVFRGYALYNSYCYRCHGTDATESQLGPNLRRSLELGMTVQQFLAVAMPGREDKGMPSWAGFLSEEEVTSIYRYVKGRSVGLLPVGRPASEFE
ncbi:MAG: c-type cytochrome [Vicinamibacterales bacterium]